MQYKSTVGNEEPIAFNNDENDRPSMIGAPGSNKKQNYAESGAADYTKNEIIFREGDVAKGNL